MSSCIFRLPNNWSSRFLAIDLDDHCIRPQASHLHHSNLSLPIVRYKQLAAKTNIRHNPRGKADNLPAGR
jgi:hypothetical protein